MKMIAWFRDDRDNRKGYDGLDEKDVERFVMELPQGAEVLYYRGVKGITGAVGAMVLSFQNVECLNKFYAVVTGDLVKELRTETWLREWDPRAWFVFGREHCGPSLKYDPSGR